jgi:capsular exopolysaccharide synthesis family protein
VTNQMSSKLLAPIGRRARVLPPLPTDPAEAEVDLVALGRTLWRGRLWLALSVVVSAAAAWVWAAGIAVPHYTARATVVLEPRQASVVDLDSVVSGLGADQMSVNTEAEVLISRRLMEQVTDRLGLTGDPEFNRWAGKPAPPPAEVQRDATIRKVAQAFSVKNVRASYVFKITAVTTAPAKSAALANALAEVYVADQLQVKFDATQAATGWLSERVAALKAELEASETAVQAFVAGTELVSPEALEGLSRQLKDTRARIADLEEAQAAAAAGRAALAGAIAAGDLAAIARAAGDSRLAAAVEGGAERAEIVARAEARVRRFAGTEARAETQIAALAASVRELAAAYDAQAADLVRLDQMQRETEASRALYETFLTRLKETAVQQGIQQPDARLLSAAALPVRASSPRTGQVVLLAMLAGALIAGAGLVLREMLHTGFRTADALEAETGHAVFGQIPRIRAKSRAAVLDHLVDHPASAAAEAVRNLRTSLILSNVDRPPKVILSTSAMPAEGKTTVAIALAQNFAGLGRRVLLMEGDIRRRVFDQYVDLEQNDGLLSVLSGRQSFEAVVQRVERIGVDVLVGGQSATNAADLFSSARFATLIEGLRQRYDVVVIDMPPVLLVPDTRIVARIADAVLFAVKWDHTSRAQIAEAIRQFDIEGTRITGLVLTQIDPKGMKKYGYAGKYGSYGGYQSKYYET